MNIWDQGLFPLRVGKPFTLRDGVAAPPSVNILLAGDAPACCCGCWDGLEAPNWKGCALGVDGAAVSGLGAPNDPAGAGKLNEKDGEGL
jgi:hypothetical protein